MRIFTLRDIGERFSIFLDLHSQPVAIKFIKNKKEFNENLRTPKKMTLCQFIRCSAIGSWDYFIRIDDIKCEKALSCFKKDDIHKDFPHLKKDIEGLFIGSLSEYKPDIIALILDTTYKAFILNKALVELYKSNMKYILGKETLICSYGIIQTYLNEMPNITFPCDVAKDIYQENELIYFIPFSISKQLLETIKFHS